MRFFFGGLVAVIASASSKALGDFAGGLALAFPAVLPAALTLAKENDGREQAADEARGARFGAVGLALFGVVVSVLVDQGPWVSLPLALLVWAVAAVSLWCLVYGRER